MNGKVVLFGMLSVAAICQGVTQEDVVTHMVTHGLVQIVVSEVLRQQPLEVRLPVQGLAVIVHVLFVLYNTDHVRARRA